MVSPFIVFRLLPDHSFGSQYNMSYEEFQRSAAGDALKLEVSSVALDVPKGSERQMMYVDVTLRARVFRTTAQARQFDPLRPPTEPLKFETDAGVLLASPPLTDDDFLVIRLRHCEMFGDREAGCVKVPLKALPLIYDDPLSVRAGPFVFTVRPLNFGKLPPDGYVPGSSPLFTYDVASGGSSGGTRKKKKKQPGKEGSTSSALSGGLSSPKISGVGGRRTTEQNPVDAPAQSIEELLGEAEGSYDRVVAQQSTSVAGGELKATWSTSAPQNHGGEQWTVSDDYHGATHQNHTLPILPAQSEARTAEVLEEEDETEVDIPYQSRSLNPSFDHSPVPATFGDPAEAARAFADPGANFPTSSGQAEPLVIHPGKRMEDRLTWSGTIPPIPQYGTFSKVRGGIRFLNNEPNSPTGSGVKKLFGSVMRAAKQGVSKVESTVELALFRKHFPELDGEVELLETYRPTMVNGQGTPINGTLFIGNKELCFDGPLMHYRVNWTSIKHYRRSAANGHDAIQIFVDDGTAWQLQHFDGIVANMGMMVGIRNQSKFMEALHFMGNLWWEEMQKIYPSA